MIRYLFFLSILAGFVALASSCNKQGDLKLPDDFDVSTSRLTYKVGDSVIFNIKSAPSQIVFYSGEPGKRYGNKDRKSMEGLPKLVFQTSMQQGILANNDSLQLLVSSNLKGYDSASIAQSTWTNITSRNTKWPTTLTTGYTTSDSINLADFNNADYINIAFRALGKKYATAAQRKWQVQNLTLTNYLPDGTATPLFNTFSNTGWVQVSLKNSIDSGYSVWNVGTWNVSAANSVKTENGVTIRTGYPITFDPGTATNVNDNDDWLITSAVNLKGVKPDQGVCIKNESSAAYAGMTYIYNRIPNVYAQYLYFFKTPGTYTVTFVAQNINVDDRKDVIKQIQLTIVP